MKTRLAAVIMAAGKGTRMKDPSMAKVMYAINGSPIISYVTGLARQIGAEKTIVVVGWQSESVIEYLRKETNIVCVKQEPQLGTGHAVMQAEEELNGFVGDVLVLSGDVPMLTPHTLRHLIAEHRNRCADVTVLTAELDDGHGYGRILRNEEGAVIGIVEEKDATEEQKEVREINSGIYLFDKDRLFGGLKQITPENAQGEYYLTDVLGYFWKEGRTVAAVIADDPMEVQGINTLEQLEMARRVMDRRA